VFVIHIEHYINFVSRGVGATVMEMLAGGRPFQKYSNDWKDKLREKSLSLKEEFICVQHYSKETGMQKMFKQNIRLL